MKWLSAPASMRRFHGFAALTWFIAAFPIMYFWSDSVRVVTFLSVYALVVSHWAAYQASRAEDAQTPPETPSETPPEAPVDWEGTPRRRGRSTRLDPRFEPDDRLSNLIKEGSRQEPYGDAVHGRYTTLTEALTHADRFNRHGTSFNARWTKDVQDGR